MSIITDGEPVTNEGYYAYAGHVNEHDDQDCIPTKIEKEGIPLFKGQKAPKLSACSHPVKWEFKKEIIQNVEELKKKLKL